MRFRNKSLDLIELLRTRKRGVRRKDLELRWTCSAATVRRVIQETKTEFGLPIRFDSSKGVYLCDSDKAAEVPGLWFGDGELAALAGLSHWLESQEPGILGNLLEPIRTRLDAILRERGINPDPWRERIRLLPMAARPIAPGLLPPVAKALLDRKRLTFAYKGVKDPAYAGREVSPQTLVRYRDNWLLDAFCHKHNALRSFALSRMENAMTLDRNATDIPRRDLDRHFAESYGIFAGRTRYKAVLLFEGLAARLVEYEIWHPNQKLRRLEDGKVRLEFPCGDLRELVRDVMRYADEVTVEGPEALHKALSEMVDRASRRRPTEWQKPGAGRPLTIGPLHARAGNAEIGKKERQG